MGDQIRAGQPVATFALPLPLTALENFRLAIEAVYGTGETRIGFRDDRVIVFAPEDGFGPRTPSFEPIPVESSAQAEEMTVTDDSVEVTIGGAEDILPLVELARRWFDYSGGINYVRSRIHVHGEEAEFDFVLQRRGGETVADHLDAAQAKLAAIRDLVDASPDSELAAAIRSTLD